MLIWNNRLVFDPIIVVDTCIFREAPIEKYEQYAKMQQNTIMHPFQDLHQTEAN